MTISMYTQNQGNSSTEMAVAENTLDNSPSHLAGHLCCNMMLDYCRPLSLCVSVSASLRLSEGLCLLGFDPALTLFYPTTVSTLKDHADALFLLKYACVHSAPAHHCSAELIMFFHFSGSHLILTNPHSGMKITELCYETG